MDDKEAIDYFLLSILADIKEEYNKETTPKESEDAYIIHRLSEISEYIVMESKK